MSDNFGEFIARLTDNARTSLQHAEAIARGQGSSYIGTEHLLLGVLAQGSSVGAKLLADAGVTLQRAEMALNLSPRTLVIDVSAKGLSETAMLTLKMAYEHARQLHQDYLGTEHILYSILRQKGSRGSVLLRDMKTDVEQLVEELEQYFDRQQSDFEDVATENDQDKSPRKNRSGLLSVYGTDMTDAAKGGKLDAVIGRDNETERLITILSRRTKNNPVLIGEPGVGKTAIVEGLAQRISRDDVPDHLLDKHVVQLDMAAMVAGTKYRGEFEERLKKVMHEVASRDDLIIFIDELHLLVGAGAAEGSMDAANILKPALARGSLHLIGATTLDEYRKHIEPDTALERRFQAIVVKEPSSSDTISILKGLKSYYESHHSVKISDEIIEKSVFVADRYITDRFRPDKAIDVIDEAAALARVRSKARPSKLRDYLREVKQLEEKIEDSVAGQDYEKAALYKTRLVQIKQKTDQLQSADDRTDALVIDESHIARAVATMTGIPVEKVEQSEQKLLKNLERELEKFVVGQKEAISTVSKAIRRGRSGIGNNRRPIGSFIFMGPTGVGKTELARVVAREVFGSDDALVKIDMSEFAEKHTTSRLVGAPAGYVGYDDGGKLTDTIRRKPYSVVLFDEIEKAHPDVFQMLLQLLEDGRLTDAKGRAVDFRHTIIILTSNLGSDAMMKESRLGFYARSGRDKAQDDAHADAQKAAKQALDKFMRPELLNRFDAIVTFRALTTKEMRKILDNQIDDLRSRLVSKSLALQISSKAKNLLIKKGFDSKNGARPLRRVIEDVVEHPIAEIVLADRYSPGDIVLVDAKNGEITIEVTSESSQ